MKLMIPTLCLLFLSNIIHADCIQGISTMEKIGQIRDVLRCLAAENVRMNAQLVAINQQTDKALKVLEGAVQQSNGKIYIGNSCFSVHQMVRCALPGGDHMTWLDNVAECGNAHGITEAQATFLAGC